MRSTFRVELDVVVDRDAAAKLIAAARESYTKQVAVSAPDDLSRDEALPAEEFITGVEDALIELVERNAAVRTGANVEFERISCRALDEPAMCDASDEYDLQTPCNPACTPADTES